MQSRTRRRGGRHRARVYPWGVPRARAGCPRIGDQRASVDTGPEGRLRPEPLTPRATEVRPRHRIRLLCRRRDRQSRHRVSRDEVRHHRFRPRRFGASPDERRGPRVPGRASRLSGRSPGCACADALSRGRGDQLGRRPAGAGGRAVHRWLPGRCERSQSSRHDVEQLHRRLSRHGERQVGRPEPDREGIASRLPGRQHLRPRGAGGGKRTWNLGDRSRCRPVPSGPAHTDERREEDGRGGVRHDRGARARDARDRSHVARFSLRNSGVDLGTISATVPHSFKAEIEDVRAEIVAGKITIASSIT